MQLFKSKYFFISLFALIFMSCGQVQRVDTTAVKEKMSERIIKRITPEQINNQVEILGEKMVNSLQFRLEKTVKIATKNELSERCLLKNNALVDSLSTNYVVKIKLLGTKDLNNKTLYTKEREVMYAYEDSAEKKQSLPTNIQNIGDSLFVYTSPISLKSEICQKCFKEDSLHLAVWSIIFKKSEVIRKIDMKHLK